MAEGPPAHDDHGQALAVATRLHATGDSASALELLPDLVAARPDDGAVRLLLARCLATAGAPAVALAAADAAVACDPTSWAAQAVLAQAAVTIDPERATAAAERAVQLGPHEPEAHRVLAAVRAALTETPAAADGPRRRPTGALGAALGRRPSTPAPVTTEPDEPRLTPRLPAALAGVAPAGEAVTTTTAPPVAAALTPAAPAAPNLDPAPASLPAADGTTTAPAAPSPDPAAPAAPPTPAVTAAPPASGPAPGAPAEGPAWASPPPPPVAAVSPTAGTLAPAPRTTPDLGGGARTEARREPPLPKALGGTGLAGAGDDTAPEEERIGGARLAVRVFGLVTWLLVGLRIGVQVVGGPIGLALFVAVLAWVAFLARRLNQR